MVPVGGAIAASSSPEFLQAMSANYPGRASISPILDLFITLLSMGERGYQSLLQERRQLLPIFQSQLQDLCSKYQMQLIASPQNTISFAISINDLLQKNKPYSFLGSMLFQRNVSGCRVVAVTGKSSTISGSLFQNWGSHINNYPYNYFTAACAIGMKQSDVELFISRLEKVLIKFIRSNTDDAPSAASTPSHAVEASFSSKMEVAITTANDNEEEVKS